MHLKDKFINRAHPTLWDRMIAIGTAILALGTFIAIVVTVHLANVQLNEQRDEVKVQHLVDESDKFDKDPLLSERRALAADRIDRTHETLRPMDYDNSPPELWDVLNACDHIGLLTRRGYLDVTDVWNEFGYWLFNIYADAEPVIQTERKSDPASMANCTWLIDQMTPIEMKDEGTTQLHPSADDLYTFYDGELGAEPGKLPTQKKAAPSH
jgi:hypothetical protein